MKARYILGIMLNLAIVGYGSTALAQQPVVEVVLHNGSAATGNGSLLASAPYSSVVVQLVGSFGERRYVHNRSHAHSNDYDAQPKGAMSYDGRYFTWTSNLDGASTAIPNHVYMVDMYPTKQGEIHMKRLDPLTLVARGKN